MDAAFPAEFDTRAFRDALGKFTTGVTVLTAHARDGSPLNARRDLVANPEREREGSTTRSLTVAVRPDGDRG